MKLLDMILKTYDDVSLENLNNGKVIDDTGNVLNELKALIGFFDGLIHTTGAAESEPAVMKGLFARIGRRIFAGGAKSKARELALASVQAVNKYDITYVQRAVEFDAAMKAATEASALSDEAITAFAMSPEAGALGDGAILGFFQRIIDWLTDPTNQEKLIKVAKFILSILAMFGLVI